MLVKLGFTQAPNTTGRQLPCVPADLMERFELRPLPPPGVQLNGSDPSRSRTLVTHTEPDDFLARTYNVLVFARGQEIRILVESPAVELGNGFGATYEHVSVRVNETAICNDRLFWLLAVTLIAHESRCLERICKVIRGQP